MTPSLNFFAKGSTSKGKANTVIQAQLNTGIEQQGGAATTFNAQDFYNIVDFDLGDNLIPNVTFYENFSRVVTLDEMKKYKELKEMRLLQKGNRLSVMPVTREEFEFIVKLGT